MKSKKAISPMMMMLIIIILAVVTVLIIFAFYFTATPKTKSAFEESSFGFLAPAFGKLADFFGLDYTAGIFLNEGDVIFVNNKQIWKCIPDECFVPDPENMPSDDTDFHPGCSKIQGFDKNLFGISVVDIENDGSLDVLFTRNGQKIFRWIKDKDSEKIAVGSSITSKLYGIDIANIDSDENKEIVVVNNLNDEIEICESDPLTWAEMIADKQKTPICSPRLNKVNHQAPLSGDFSDIDLANLDRQDLEYTDLLVGDASYFWLFDLNKPLDYPVSCYINNPHMGDVQGIATRINDNDETEIIVTDGYRTIWACEYDANLCSEDKGLECEPLCLTNQKAMKSLDIVEYEQYRAK